jgi:hypothetical protein
VADFAVRTMAEYASFSDLRLKHRVLVCLAQCIAITFTGYMIT